MTYTVILLLSTHPDPPLPERRAVSSTLHFAKRLEADHIPGWSAEACGDLYQDQAALAFGVSPSPRDSSPKGTTASLLPPLPGPGSPKRQLTPFSPAAQSCSPPDSGPTPEPPGLHVPTVLSSSSITRRQKGKETQLQSEAMDHKINHEPSYTTVMEVWDVLFLKP